MLKLKSSVGNIRVPSPRRVVIMKRRDSMIGSIEAKSPLKRRGSLKKTDVLNK